MKSRGILFKNIAGLLLLCSLLTLLLPCFRVSTPNKEMNFSGYGVARAGIRLAIEYQQKGQIEDTFLVKDSITWGELKEAGKYFLSEERQNQTVVVLFLLLLPILLNMLTMLLCWLAIGKKTMVLPTLVNVASVFLSFYLLFTVQTIISKRIVGMEITLLIGIFLFLIFSVVPLLLLVYMWITKGFDSEVEKEEGDQKRSNREKKERNTKKKKGKRKKERRKKTKKKTVSEKDKTEKDGKDEAQPRRKPGNIIGQSGLYKGVDLNLSDGVNYSHAFSLKEDGQSGTYFIEFDKNKGEYTITNHSSQTLLLKTENEKLKFIAEGEVETVKGHTVLQVGNTDNILKLN